MKLLVLVVAALYACAHAGVTIQNEIGDNIKAHLGRQELQFHAGSTVITDDDQQLIAELQTRETQDRNLVANAIRDALEGFRDDVINGNDVLPPLDPFHVPHIGPFEYSATAIRVRGNLHNFQMEGLRWYVVDHVTFNTLRLALGVQITVPWLTFTGSYDAFARVALVTHNAGGNYRVFINRLQTSVDVRVGTNILGGGTLILRELNIDIVIHNINIQIDGMVGSSLLNNMINAWVQNMAQNLLRDELEAFSQLLSQQLFDVVAEFLANFTLDDLLG
ncbi:uncharacterized protein LOC126381901 [Pectinophora gossypiella]|uniref:uncharacterized protein LOC126381901 n=1 Tax=Pectinophora gossypiella TaxID=13191 RepID=UPI00214E3B3B|nr:uncharacterized protein LOC126381901 [Pectinophora gossypiella]